jgi:hypothetical protein
MAAKTHFHATGANIVDTVNGVYEFRRSDLDRKDAVLAWKSAASAMVRLAQRYPQKFEILSCQRAAYKLRPIQIYSPARAVDSFEEASPLPTYATTAIRYDEGQFVAPYSAGFTPLLLDLSDWRSPWQQGLRRSRDGDFYLNCQRSAPPVVSAR